MTSSAAVGRALAAATAPSVAGSGTGATTLSPASTSFFASTLIAASAGRGVQRDAGRTADAPRRDGRAVQRDDWRRRRAMSWRSWQVRGSRGRSEPAPSALTLALATLAPQLLFVDAFLALPLNRGLAISCTLVISLFITIIAIWCVDEVRSHSSRLSRDPVRSCFEPRLRWDKTDKPHPSSAPLDHPPATALPRPWRCAQLRQGPVCLS